MWSPTHIQVTVQRAKSLLTKGKNGTNNCFVTIGLGKEKYQTSVKEKAETDVNWNEECELKIPDQGNRAELVLTCLHRNNIGIDEFLGQATLPLNEMDVYDRPRSKWFKLESKPGKEKKNKERGELEVRISFVVKSGSLTDLSKKEKHKSSIGQLASSVGGSLLSINTIEKRKGLKKFAKSLGSKMHLHSKKKNKDGDDLSISGSFASIDTPNSSSHGGSKRYGGQRAGEADPGVISEDEDEFVFDNLSHKSSGSSLNIRSAGVGGGGGNVGLQPPNPNYAPRNPSPLLGGSAFNGKAGGKQPNVVVYGNKNDVDDDDDYDDEAQLEQLENDFSLRARTLPPPSKPPRTQQQLAAAATIAEEQQQLNEWESKLYGKHLDAGSSDSLKRRSWDTSRVPLPSTSEEVEEEKALPKEKPSKIVEHVVAADESSDTVDSDTEDEVAAVAELPAVTLRNKEPPRRPITLGLEAAGAMLPPSINLLSSPETEKNDFNQFNATFAKFEQRNSAKIFNFEPPTTPPPQAPKKWDSQALIDSEAQKMSPKPLPRGNSRGAELEAAKAAAALKAKERQEEVEKRQQEEAEKRKIEEAALRKQAAEEEERRRQREEDEEQERRQLAAEQERRQLVEEQQRQQQMQKLKLQEEQRLKDAEIEAEEEKRQRLEEDARLAAELRLNEQRLEEAQKLAQREAKRREEDQRILNFAKRSTSLEESDEGFTTPPPLEESPKMMMNNSSAAADKKEKRFSKFKYFNKRDKQDDDNSSSSPSPKSNERIIIGKEKSATHAERRTEITAALTKKYDGKSREELMLIANGMENEALLQRQRVKELEDYLDNLLLRVMETHPKILQNPYSRTTSAKSG